MGFSLGVSKQTLDHFIHPEVCSAKDEQQPSATGSLSTCERTYLGESNHDRFNATTHHVCVVMRMP